MIMTLFGALSAGTKTYLLCRSDRQAFTSAFCNTLPVGCLKFSFILEIRSSICPFTISFQDDRTESSTISRDELTIQNGILIKGMKVVIPQALKHEMIKRTHSSHLGIEASLRKARDMIYWPGMNADIRDFIGQCSTCNELGQSNARS